MIIKLDDSLDLSKEISIAIFDGLVLMLDLDKLAGSKKLRIDGLSTGCHGRA